MARELPWPHVALFFSAKNPMSSLDDDKASIPANYSFGSEGQTMVLPSIVVVAQGRTLSLGELGIGQRTL